MCAIGLGLALSMGVGAPAMAQNRATAAKVEEVSLADISAAIASGRMTSHAATQAYLARIAAMDRSGPTLRSVIAIHPNAMAQARAVRRTPRRQGVRTVAWRADPGEGQYRDA